MSFDRTLVYNMEDPSSKARKSVVRIGAITFKGLIKLGLYQFCLLAMVLLVGISMFLKSPLIGGEMNVQIRFPIWTRLTLGSIMGLVYYQKNTENLTTINRLYGGTKYAFENKGCYRRSKNEMS